MEINRFKLTIPTTILPYHVLNLIIIFFFLMPSSGVLGGKSPWYLLCLMMTMFSCILGYRVKLSKNILIGTLIFLLALISVSISLIRSIDYIITDDYFELIRTIALLFFILNAYLLSNHETEKFLIHFFKFYLWVQFTVCVLQKVPSIKAALSIVWDMQKAWILRSTGTAQNPNTLVLMSIIAYVYVSVYSTSKSTRIVFLILTSLIVLLSGSRTGLLGFMVVVLASNFINQKISFLFVIKSISVVLLVLACFYGIVSYIAESNAYMGELLRIVEGGNIDLTKVHTFNKRLKSWTEHYDYFHSSGFVSYFIGIGPAKGIGFRVMDNDYSSVLIKYGAFGVIVYSIIFVYLTLIGIGNKVNKPERMKFLLLVLVAFLIFAITGAAFLSLFNFVPVLMVAGIYLKLKFLENRDYNEAPIHILPRSQKG